MILYRPGASSCVGLKARDSLVKSKVSKRQVLMQNKFGLKDFVLMVLVVLVGVFTLMNIKEGDRRWKKSQELLAKVGTVEQQVAKLDRKLQESQAGNSELLTQISDVSGQVASLKEMLSSGAFSVNIASSGSSEDAVKTDRSRPPREQWAHLGGAEIKWQPPVNFQAEPFEMDGYRLGGEFTEIFGAQLSKLTPVLAEDTYAARINDQVCERLASLNPVTLKYEGRLAEAWQYDPDGYWLRVKLRDNISFSDGVEITSEDVRWTFHDYINNPELETEALRSIMTSIESVKVISDKVFEFTFKTPDAYNMQTVFGFYILPKHFYSKFTPSQINQSTALSMGSGPFKLDNLDVNNQWAPGKDVVLVRNEQYWGPKPALESMRYKVIIEDIGRLTEFRNGNASMIPLTPPQFVNVSREEGWDDFAYSLKWTNMRSGYAFIGWQCGPRNGKLTPFHDKRVRQAMTMIINRQLIIDDIYNGIGEVAVGPNNPPSPAANPKIEPWPYDIDRAKALLAEAGWVDSDDDGILENERGDEFVFELTRPAGGQTIERLQKYIVDQCASVGIRCNPKIVDWSLYDQILKNRDFDSLIMGWSATDPESDPKQIWHTDSIQNQGNNFIQWDAGQDQYIDKIKLTLDFDERMKVFHQFHTLINEEQPYTFLRVGPWLRFVNKDFKNVHTYPKGLEQREYYYAP
jgi:peptide/nickel transport system substrate-binding protein